MSAAHFVPMGALLDRARVDGYALGGFGFSNLEQLHAICRAAHATQSPLILMISSRNADYAGMEYLAALAHVALREYDDLPIALHLDHGRDLAECRRALELGFSSVMIDGSLDAAGRPAA